MAVDAKYIHTNLAVHSLKAYSNKFGKHISIAQYSINHSEDQILRGIYLENPDVVAFSCYIWNISMISSIIKSLKKIKPQVKIWFGGPEVSISKKAFKVQGPDGIVVGEGEQTFMSLWSIILGKAKN